MIKLKEILFAQRDKFKLPELPYSLTKLSPVLKTIDIHYNKHHKGYVDKLNENIKDTKYEFLSLEAIITHSRGQSDVYNNAAQHFNHTFLWNCWSPAGGGKPQSELADLIDRDFGSFAEFKKLFIEKGKNHFGSGWVWLYRDGTRLMIQDMHDADNPLLLGVKPLLVCDLWEHAYYLDYKNDREKFLKATFDVVNWDFVQGNL